jgi:hypothetical protein
MSELPRTNRQFARVVLGIQTFHPILGTSTDFGALSGALLSFWPLRFRLTTFAKSETQQQTDPEARRDVLVRLGIVWNVWISNATT